MHQHQRNIVIIGFLILIAMMSFFQKPDITGNVVSELLNEKLIMGVSNDNSEVNIIVENIGDIDIKKLQINIIGDMENHDQVIGDCTATILSPGMTQEFLVNDLNIGEIQALIIEPFYEDCTPGETSSVYFSQPKLSYPSGIHRVFVTSQTFRGNLGEGSTRVEGGNIKCQQAADNAGLGGEWKAWLSATEWSPSGNQITPIDTFVHSDLPYLLLDGTLIADNWDDLTDGVNYHHIDVNEFGEKITDQPYFAWTGTQNDGTYLQWHCSSWFTISGSGKVGFFGPELPCEDCSGSWSDAGTQECSNYNRLYCFEQTIHTCSDEICDDEIDNDCDGKTDTDDTDCCIGEGESIPNIPDPLDCCPGLEMIQPQENYMIGILGYCTANCGDGNCDGEIEDNTNCPQDCRCPAGHVDNGDGSCRAIFYSLTADGKVSNSMKLTWAEARAGSGFPFVRDNVEVETGSQAIFSSSKYSVSRFFFYFDTSSLPDDAVIDSSQLKFYGYSSSTNVVLQRGTQLQPLRPGDFNALSGEIAGTSSCIKNSWNTMGISEQGLGIINKQGVTKFAMREYAHDFLDVAPTSYIYSCGLYTGDASEDKKPYLSVTYATGECGDGYCNSFLGETTVTCQEDCCVDVGYCGDGICDYYCLHETIGSCPSDCCIDEDGDGYNLTHEQYCGKLDCDDTNQEIYPGRTEVCSDGLDNNCDRIQDCDDGSCAISDTSCENYPCMQGDINNNDSTCTKIIRANIDDASIGYYDYSGTWNGVRNAVSGNSYNNPEISLDHWAILAAPRNIHRFFMKFYTGNLKTLPAEVEIDSVNLYVHGYKESDTTGGFFKVAAQKATEPRSYSGFTGDVYGYENIWNAGSWNKIGFNSQGRQDINRNGFTNVVLREYDYDYLDVEPPDSYPVNEIYTGNSGIYPYLKITYVVQGTGMCGNGICEEGEVCQEDCSYEMYCDDGMDNDEDGTVDCGNEPPPCGDDRCEYGEECKFDCLWENYCDDGADNDEQGGTDCNDDYCSNKYPCKCGDYLGALCCPDGTCKRSSLTCELGVCVHRTCYSDADCAYLGGAQCYKRATGWEIVRKWACHDSLKICDLESVESCFAPAECDAELGRCVLGEGGQPCGAVYCEMGTVCTIDGCTPCGELGQMCCSHGVCSSGFCEGGCSESACVNGICGSSCNDNDGGANLHQKGWATSEYYSDPVWDFCYQNGKVGEWECVGNELLQMSYTCPEGEMCIDGACAGQNQDECVAGEVECFDMSSYRRCGNYDADPHLEWEYHSCGSGTCLGGGCVLGYSEYANDPAYVLQVVACVAILCLADQDCNNNYLGGQALPPDFSVPQECWDLIDTLPCLEHEKLFCSDGKDNDCDGTIDNLDPDCLQIEVSVSTLHNVYSLGEHIQITDPPAKQDFDIVNSKTDRARVTNSQNMPLLNRHELQHFSMSEGVEVENIVVNKEFKTCIEIPLDYSKDTSSASFSGRVQLTDKKGFARVILRDKDNREYLMFGSDSLILEDKLKVNNFCEETCQLPGIKVKSIVVEVEDAILNLDSIHIKKKGFFEALTKPVFSAGEHYRENRDNQHSIKINKWNEKIKRENMLWKAGETSVSRLSFSEKKKLFGNSLPNLEGFEYYTAGIFELRDEEETGRIDTSGWQVMTTSSTGLAEDWDWRNRHGENWITPIKDQGNCGSCWAHSATAATELLVNLYFNQHLDLDLSEQDALSCSGAGSCSGGSPSLTLDYYSDIGVVDENCFPYTASNDPCSKCANPSETIKIGARVDCSPAGGICDSEEDLKEKIIEYGGVSSALGPWNHAMQLIGYKVLEEGDTIHTDDLGNTETINPGDSRIGQTYWIFKNSWGIGWGEEGYGNIIVDSINQIRSTYALTTPITSEIASYDIQCVDKDSDSYCNWGISNDKPPSCPSHCKTKKDCDDSNPDLGSFDVNYNCLPLQSKIHNFGNTELQGELTIIVQRLEEQWLDYQTVVSYQTVTIPANGVVKLDQYFNPVGVSADLPGRYRIYVKTEILGKAFETYQEFDVV